MIRASCCSLKPSIHPSFPTVPSFCLPLANQPIPTYLHNRARTATTRTCTCSGRGTQTCSRTSAGTGSRTTRSTCRRTTSPSTPRTRTMSCPTSTPPSASRRPRSAPASPPGRTWAWPTSCEGDLRRRRRRWLVGVGVGVAADRIRLLLGFDCRGERRGRGRSKIGRGMKLFGLRRTNE